jgi:hypothetical protein
MINNQKNEKKIIFSVSSERPKHHTSPMSDSPVASKKRGSDFSNNGCPKSQMSSLPGNATIVTPIIVPNTPTTPVTNGGFRFSLPSVTPTQNPIVVPITPDVFQLTSPSPFSSPFTFPPSMPPTVPSLGFASTDAMPQIPEVTKPVETHEAFDSLLDSFCLDRKIKRIVIPYSMSGKYPMFKRIVEKILLILYMTSQYSSLKPDCLANIKIRLSPDEAEFFGRSADIAVSKLKDESWPADVTEILSNSRFISSHKLDRVMTDYGCNCCKSEPGCILYKNRFEYQPCASNDFQSLRFTYDDIKNLKRSGSRESHIYLDPKCSEYARAYATLFNYRMTLIINCQTYMATEIEKGIGPSDYNMSKILASNFIFDQYSQYVNTVDCLMTSVSTANA